MSDKARPSAPTPVWRRHILEVRGMIRGVPSSISRGDVDRNRNGMDMYTPPEAGMDSKVFGADDSSFDSSTHSERQSATMGTPKVDARRARTTWSRLPEGSNVVKE